jgi:hypothetical protein
MSLLAIISSSILAAAMLAGQEKPAEPKKEAEQGSMEAAIIPVKTLTGDSFDRLVNMLRVFNVKYSADNKLRTILVYAPKDVVAQIRRVVEQLDRPGSEAAVGRNIEMTMTFLRCSIKPSGSDAPIPTDLEPVVRQLRAATPYKEVKVWETLPLHLQEGKETNQSIRLPTVLPDIPAVPTANIKISPESVIKKDAGRYVRFDRLSIGFRIPYATSRNPIQFQFMELGLNTAGDFKEGQKSVLGKIAGVDEESAVFVVIALQVLD